METHNENQSVCSVCGKALSSKQNLKQHMNIHTGNRPYKCSYPDCHQAYKHSSQLSNHKLLHQQNTLKIKYRFDDMKSFASLLIRLLEGESKKEFQIEPGPYTEKDVKLPLIVGPQGSIKLPSIKLQV